MNGTRTCQVSGCNAVMRPAQRVCEAHWAAIPGIARKKLSMSRHGPVADQMWSAACAKLEAGA